MRPWARLSGAGDGFSPNSPSASGRPSPHSSGKIRETTPFPNGKLQANWWWRGESPAVSLCGYATCFAASCSQLPHNVHRVASAKYRPARPRADALLMSRYSSYSSAPAAGSTPHACVVSGKRVSMVEAGGVEPPSEDSLLRATTCVSGHLILVPGDPGRQGSLRTIPVWISPFLPPGGGFGLSR